MLFLGNSGYQTALTEIELVSSDSINSIYSEVFLLQNETKTTNTILIIKIIP